MVTVVLLAAFGVPPECNDRNVWDANLVREVKAGVAEVMGELEAAGVKVEDKARKKLEGKLFSRLLWRIVRAHIIGGNNNNAAAIRLKRVKTDKGKPVTLYRSAFTPHPEAEGSCFGALVKKGVRHVVNLYGGPMETADLEAAERKVVEAAGGTYFLARDAGEAQANWREDLRHGGDPKEVQKAVAQLINEQILRPGGKKPRGDIHVHCGGGMHRTGMVVGIIDRCLNTAGGERVMTHYRKHVGWQRNDEPGGYEQENLKFIGSFDCTLLKP